LSTATRENSRHESHLRFAGPVPRRSLPTRPVSPFKEVHGVGGSRQDPGSANNLTRVASPAAANRKGHEECTGAAVAFRSLEHSQLLAFVLRRCPPHLTGGATGGARHRLVVGSATRGRLVAGGDTRGCCLLCLRSCGRNAALGAPNVLAARLLRDGGCT
jgi:hypothetical protein